MSNYLKIRWHSRGGLGAKTASLMLARLSIDNNLFATGFPEYGPERMGAPITAYNKIGKSTIRDHSNIDDPDIVVVVDKTLIGQVDILGGTNENSIIIINAEDSKKAEIKKSLSKFKGRIFLIDAKKISIEEINKNMPNMVLLSSVVRISNLINEEKLILSAKNILAEKFSNKKELIKGNIESIKRGYKELVKI